MTDDSAAPPPVDGPEPRKTREIFRVIPPGDGAYKVRFIGEDVANVVTTMLAGPKETKGVSLSPGVYSVIIDALDASDPFIQTINVSSGQHTIKLASANTSERISFSETQSLRPQLGKLSIRAIEARQAAERISSARSMEDLVRLEATYDEKALAPSERRFAVGVSRATGTGQGVVWKAANPDIRYSNLTDRGLGLLINRPENWRHAPRWRATVALQDDFPWRTQLPLFEGGVQVFFSPVETDEGADIALTLAPRDPRTAALLQTLDCKAGAGGSSEDDILELLKWATSSRDDNLESCTDPWAVVLEFILLAQRGMIDKAGHRPVRLAQAFPWLSDGSIAAAWSVAATVEDNTYETQCIFHLAEARRRGTPFFMASSLLAGEMLRTLAVGAESKLIRKQAQFELSEWSRHSRYIVRSGPILSWERQDIALQPREMAEKEFAVIAHGYVSGRKIKVDFDPDFGASAEPLSLPPALLNPIYDTEDPNRGRFGGSARSGGFETSATFRQSYADWVEITCSVRCVEPNLQLIPGEKVSLFLHDTFRPDRVELELMSREAQYTFLAYGGFTIGIWIPRLNIQLELDLAALPDAPQAIREL
jgi:hypothetical protein